MRRLVPVLLAALALGSAAGPASAVPVCDTTRNVVVRRACQAVESVDTGPLCSAILQACVGPVCSAVLDTCVLD